MIAVLNLGRCEYATALRLQESLVELRQQARVPNVLLFVEHPPVITLGRNARQANIVVPQGWLAARGVEVHEINRGGDVTFHGPGQLVAYPIFDLRSFSPRRGAVSYVRLLEDVLMRVCAQYGIETQRIQGLTGVWTHATAPPRLVMRVMERDYVAPEEDAESTNNMGQRPHSDETVTVDDEAVSRLEATQVGAWPERKIAAIGVHIARGVTSHGFALNVTTDLEFFRLIVPCGLTRPVTSIAFETGEQPSFEEVAVRASRCFGERFASQMLWLESIHDLMPEQGDSGDAGVVETPSTAAEGFGPVATPDDTPARAPENERRVASDDIHLA
jgi:lipoyl(octanoyl) transferase